ncbi:MAG: CBM9 family sugar-binding protein [Oscillospiraceae bacterium]|nr:CBM9 family sugar-binding protein [Oscillospiraceae bacterium]
MKKLLAFAVILTMAFALAVPAGAVSLTVNNASPAIDGVRDEAYSGPVAIASFFQNGDGTNSMSGATGNAWIAWDGSALYYYIEIYDKTPNFTSETEGGHNVDNIEIYIDWNNAKGAGLGAPVVDNGDSWGTDSVGTEDGYPYWQVRVPADGSELSGAIWFDMDWGGVEWASEAHEYFAGPLDGNYSNGYIVEIKVHLPGGVSLSEGKTIGFDFGIGDNIDGSGRGAQIYVADVPWNDLQWSTPTACSGVMTLGGAYAAPEAPAPDSGANDTAAPPAAAGGGDPAPETPPPVQAPPSPATGDPLMITALAALLSAGFAALKKKSK